MEHVKLYHKDANEHILNTGSSIALMTYLLVVGILARNQIIVF
jgi:hypothetical protein